MVLLDAFRLFGCTCRSPVAASSYSGGRREPRGRGGGRGGRGGARRPPSLHMLLTSPGIKTAGLITPSKHPTAGDTTLHFSQFFVDCQIQMKRSEVLSKNQHQLQLHPYGLFLTTRCNVIENIDIFTCRMSAHLD